MIARAKIALQLSARRILPQKQVPQFSNDFKTSLRKWCSPQPEYVKTAFPNNQFFLTQMKPIGGTKRAFAATVPMTGFGDWRRAIQV